MFTLKNEILFNKNENNNYDKNLEQMELRQYLLNYNHNVEVLVKLFDKKIIEMNKIVIEKNNFIYFVLF